MNKAYARAILASSVSALALLSGAGAFAAEAANTGEASNTGVAQNSSAGAEGSDIGSIIVTAERGIAAKTAPVKASLDQTQPESIISHTFIEQITPEAGNISTVVFIAPSISGISSNAGGIGNYFSTTMRGFSDGSYNVTYDGIAFGDTNNPTHHPNDYFPTSTIGAAVVDRGPGAAGDLGQANYGGAIHYFSPTPTDTFGAQQKVTYGSFVTEAAVTTINTGEMPALGGGKLLLNFDERRSNTELSDSEGDAFNQLAKFVLPIGNKFQLTAFISHAWSRYNFPDGNGPGETLEQLQAYGKNYQLNDVPTNADYVGFNFERKQTWFNYLDLKYQVSPAISVEDEPYHYFYSNKTESATDTQALLTGPNPSPTKPANGGDIGGYHKRNDYTVYGNILRFTDQTPWGLLKFGALVESSFTYRQKAYYDLTLGTPDNEYAPGGKNVLLTTTTNCQTCEQSDWLQEQGFIDFDWTPLDNLKISPGFKYVNFKRDINAAEDKQTVNGLSGIDPVRGTNTYDSPLYFLTANYKILPVWSVYAQYATSFLIPQLSELQVPGVNLQNLRPETTTNYQLGTVYTRGSVTADADVYLIDAANTNVACNIPNPQGGVDSASCNAGTVTYSGFEGEGAYALRFGLTLFVNGSINNARQAAQGPNNLGITVHPAQELASTPDSTFAVGGIYHHGPWQASLTYKRVGAEVEYGGAQITVPAYDTTNASAEYDFTHFQVKLQCFNLFDRRALSGYTPGGSETALYKAGSGGEYTFQSGRELDLTLVAKY